jgi:hypothetical protein
MNVIRRTLEIDAGTDARLTEMAAERGQDVAAVLAEAVALLDSVVDLARPGHRRGSSPPRRVHQQPQGRSVERCQGVGRKLGFRA